MKIAFNIQMVVSGEKSGIGYAQELCMRPLIARHPDDKFFLEFFLHGDLFDFFSLKKTKLTRQKALAYCKENVELSVCAFFPSMAYRFISALAPLPYRAFIKTKADVSHFFNFIIPPFVYGKKIVTIHDLAFKRFPQTVRLRTRRMLEMSLHKSVKRADRIIAVSEFTKKEILEFYDYPAENIKVVYNGVDTARFSAEIPPAEIAETRKRYAVPDDYILYLGTIEPRKNLERLIQAYALVKKKRKIPALVIVGGKGWLFGGVFQTVKALHLEDSVLFTGYIPEAAKPSLFAGARCFCFPSLYEGFGMPVLEAMATGTPVLTSDNSALPEVAGDAALLVNAFSVEAMSEALEKLCFDETLRAELREKGFERVKRFSWEKSADQLYDLYKETSE